MKNNEGIINFALRNVFFYFEGLFNMMQNLSTWGRRLYLPSEGRRDADFFVLKNSSPSSEFETVNLGSNGKHANH
jgi:hypothetical protein